MASKAVIDFRALALPKKGTDLRACRQGIVGTTTCHGQRTGGIGQQQSLIELATAG